MRFGSLFSGIGGFDLGFEQAGMECAWQCEIDPHARAVLARHWPEVPCYDDVRAIGAGGDVPRVDLICGGFPCQDVSVAGRRAGLAGERSGLWFEFHRVLAELQPPWVVIENVPGLLSSWSGDTPGSLGIEPGPGREMVLEEGSDFGAIIDGLAELGYVGAWWSPDAQWFGVAQRRRRVFIVGHLGDGRAAEVLPIPAGMFGSTPPKRPERQTVARDVAPSLTGSGRGTAPVGESRGQDPIVITRRGRGEGSADEIERSNAAPALRTYGGGSSIPVVSIGDLNPKWQGNSGGMELLNVVLGTMTARMNVALGARDVEEGAIQVAQGRPRRLMPIECERLQGFPDGWTDGQADTHRYKQLGNAVAVPVARWIGERIVAASTSDV